MKVFKKSFHLVFFLAAVLCTRSGSSQASPPNTAIHVVTFNVLAPWVASPTHYPALSAPYLDRGIRRERIIHFLNTIAPETDIIALQESSPSEYKYFKQALQNDFYALQANHDPNYWADWVTEDLPWESHGVAIFAKKKSFCNVLFRDLPLSKDGNHAAYFEGVQCGSKIPVRAASVHFDCDSDQNRHNELQAILEFLAPGTASIDIIAGDFNFGTHEGTMKQYLDKHRFIDVLASLNREEWTCPYRKDEYQSKNWGILDHIVTRNSIPVDGKIYNFDLWRLYPEDEDGRITRNLQLSGSDHFPVSGTVRPPSM